MLAISGLSKTYANGVRALDGVSLTIGRGLFGLLGPNGAGKSTLMRTIAALQEPDEGEIRLDGHDVLAEPQELRRWDVACGRRGRSSPSAVTSSMHGIVSFRGGASERGGRSNKRSASRLVIRFLPRASFILGLRDASLLAVDRRWEPGAGNPPAGLCPGDGPKGPSLPGLGGRGGRPSGRSPWPTRQHYLYVPR
jgi:energy-coupling factor transporter ATP-binding protein EcfA2